MCTPTPETIFSALCERIRVVEPGWPGTGHPWTRGVVYWCIGGMIPDGASQVHEWPVQNPTGRIDTVWTKGDPFVEDNIEFLLALESQWQEYGGPSETWQAVVDKDLRKMQIVQAHLNVLVTARDSHQEVQLALDHLKTAAAGFEERSYLFVVLGPPPEGRSCIAHGLASPDCARLGPVTC